MSNNLSEFPKDLPIPVDDGGASHLPGIHLPEAKLPSTDGTSVKLSQLKGSWVLYVYPMTGKPGVPLPEGWDEIPGARGCTPQACCFRDHYAELQSLNTGVFGLSAQNSAEQREAKERLHLPFHLLSDSQLTLKQSIRLPTFKAASMELFKRLTLIAKEGRIVKVFYPVFPPDRNADEVIAWLRDNI